MSERQIKKLRKAVKKKYNDINFDKASFKQVWRTIKSGIKQGLIKKGASGETISK